MLAQVPYCGDTRGETVVGDFGRQRCSRSAERFAYNVGNETTILLPHEKTLLRSLRVFFSLSASTDAGSTLIKSDSSSVQFSYFALSFQFSALSGPGVLRLARPHVYLMLRVTHLLVIEITIRISY